MPVTRPYIVAEECARPLHGAELKWSFVHLFTTAKNKAIMSLLEVVLCAQQKLNGLTTDNLDTCSTAGEWSGVVMKRDA